MQVQQISNQEWQKALLEINENTFLHSLQWEQFNNLNGNSSFKFAIFSNQNQLVSLALILKIKAKRASFLLVPHGPQVLPSYKNETEAILKIWKQHFTTLAQQEKTSFVRIQPILGQSQENQTLFTKLGFKKAPIHMHTELTTLLNLEGQTEKLLLLGMRKTTRQMIKKGLKQIEAGEVKITYPESISEEMWDVYTQTGKRGQFVIYSRQFLENEWRCFKETGSTLICVYSGENLLSWGMILVSGSRAFYHQGANLLDKKVPSSYLCQWHGISYALAKNCISYDFWGVAPLDKPNHPWTSISLFKRGFGGQDVRHLAAQDLILNWKYWPNWLLEKYRAAKRGFN